MSIPIDFRDLGPGADSLMREVLEGLKEPVKKLPCKLFYDEHGSHLFEQICELDEYYPTRTETAIMKANIAEIAPLISGFGARLRSLDRSRRQKWLRRVEHAPAAQLRMIVKLLVSVAQLAYYGDDAVMLRLGYDAEANLQRGRELRAKEGRP